MLMTGCRWPLKTISSTWLRRFAGTDLRCDRNRGSASARRATSSSWCAGRTCLRVRTTPPGSPGLTKAYARASLTLVRVDRNRATHAVYWPLVLLVHIIGPHMVNGACSGARVGRAVVMRYCGVTLVAVDIGVRLKHGTDVTVQKWQTMISLADWTKYA